MSLVNFVPLPRTVCRHHIVQLYNHTCTSATGAITVPSMAQVHPSYGRMPYLVQKRSYNMVSIPPQTHSPDGFERGGPRLSATPTLKNVRSAFTCLALWSKHEHVMCPGRLAVGEHQPARVQRVSHIHILVCHCRHHPRRSGQGRRCRVWWGDERLRHEGRLCSVEEVEQEEGGGLGRVWLSMSGVRRWVIWGEWESCGTNEGHQWEHGKTYEREQGHLYAYLPDK